MTFTISKSKLALAVVAVALIIPSTAMAFHVFDDVPDDKFYADPVEWAFDNGITTGKTATTFAPDDGVTRGEAVTFLKRYNDNVVEPAIAELQDADDELAADIDDVASEAAIAINENEAAIAVGHVLEPGGIVGFGAVSTPQTVGELALPAGDYIVNAALVVNNNNGSTQTVGCELLLDSSVIDGMADNAFQISATGTGGERESIALTGAGTLAASGTANVVCQTSASSGNYLDLTITAIQISTLTVTADSGAPTPGSSPADAEAS